MNLPLVSIITISFNSEKTIERTIKSVLDQTYQNIEYVIVDGLSNDKTLDIVTSYEDKFIKKGFKLKYISESDQGISDAFNKGIKLVSGDLVGIINSDDWFEKNAVDMIIKNLDDKCDIYCGDLKLYDVNLEYIGTRKSRTYLLPIGMYVMHPTVFVKKHVYLETKFDIDLKIAMDYDLLLKFRKRGFKIKNTNEIISNMRLGGISCDINKMRYEEKIVMKRNLTLPFYFLARIKFYAEQIILKGIGR
ncbi:glycosyltransferase family 2 protein [Flavobacterium magnesitis]|uniref:glycosyltransferase family 2 protein n=1 Tax=Flavobacterium magnesitis TaxID=3138077 RepID=UPI00358FD65E